MERSYNGISFFAEWDAAMEGFTVTLLEPRAFEGSGDTGEHWPDIETVSEWAGSDLANEEVLSGTEAVYRPRAGDILEAFGRLKRQLADSPPPRSTKCPDCGYPSPCFHEDLRRDDELAHQHDHRVGR